MDQAGETILRLRNENAKLREEVKWGETNLDSCISGQDAIRKQLEAAKLEVEQLKCDIVKVVEADASEVRNLKLQIDAMRPVVEAAIAYEVDQETWDRLSSAIDAYKLTNPVKRKDQNEAHQDDYEPGQDAPDLPGYQRDRPADALGVDGHLCADPHEDRTRAGLRRSDVDEDSEVPDARNDNELSENREGRHVG